MTKYVSPSLNEDFGFTCPHCETLTTHEYMRISGDYAEKDISYTMCNNCSEVILWEDENLVYPIGNLGLPPIEGMPKKIKEIYNEASKIVNLSPRASCGLLRLAVETLLNDMDIEGKTLDNKIGNLVKKGLPEEIQKSLDSLRVIGNDALHDGQMDLNNNVDTAKQLFDILNFIVEEQINRPKRIKAIYDSLPENKKEGIKNRDKTHD